MNTFGGYEKLAREGVPIAHQHHHHFHYPGGVYHTLGNFAAEAFQHKKHTNANGDLVSWTPDSDVCETKIAYHIEMEVAGVSDKKAIKIAWLSPRTLQVDGAAMRADLIRGREGDGEPMWESDVVSGGSGSETSGVSKKPDVKAKDGEDGGPCIRCADCENEVTTKIIHGERKIGSWRRTFTMPIGCDMTTLRAKLDSGLLHISVFKKKVVDGEGPVKVVEVE